MNTAIVTVRELKHAILSVVSVQNDAIHIYIGVGVLFATAFILRSKLRSYWLLLPGFILSLFLEVPDLWFNYIEYQGFAWRASFVDVVNTSLIPAFLIFVARLRFPEVVSKSAS